MTINLVYIQVITFFRLVYFYNFRGLTIFIKLLGKNGIAEVKIPGYKQKYFLRRGTSDIAVFNSIHAFNEFNYNFKIPENGVILDCGANIGISTTYFAEKYPHALIIALEPSPINFEFLQKILIFMKMLFVFRQQYGVQVVSYLYKILKMTNGLSGLVKSKVTRIRKLVQSWQYQFQI